MPSIDLERARQEGLDMLTAAFSGGAIDVDEYERRAGGVQSSVSPDEIQAALADLPRAAPGARVAPSASTAAEEPPKRRHPDRLAHSGPSEMVVSIMSERRMSGDWLAGDAVTNLTIMGSSVFDLRSTALPYGRLRIEVFTLMGETRIIVPRGVPVRLSAFPLMGEAKVGPGIDRRIQADSPWIEVSGMAIMGSIVVQAAD